MEMLLHEAVNILGYQDAAEQLSADEAGTQHDLLPNVASVSAGFERLLVDRCRKYTNLTFSNDSDKKLVALQSIQTLLQAYYIVSTEFFKVKPEQLSPEFFKYFPFHGFVSKEEEMRTWESICDQIKDINNYRCEGCSLLEWILAMPRDNLDNALILIDHNAIITPKALKGVLSKVTSEQASQLDRLFQNVSADSITPVIFTSVANNINVDVDRLVSILKLNPEAVLPNKLPELLWIMALSESLPKFKYLLEFAKEKGINFKDNQDKQYDREDEYKDIENHYEKLIMKILVSSELPEELQHSFISLLVEHGVSVENGLQHLDDSLDEIRKSLTCFKEMSQVSSIGSLAERKASMDRIQKKYDIYENNSESGLYEALRERRYAHFESMKNNNYKMGEYSEAELQRIESILTAYEKSRSMLSVFTTNPSRTPPQNIEASIKEPTLEQVTIASQAQQIALLQDQVEALTARTLSLESALTGLRQFIYKSSMPNENNNGKGDADLLKPFY